MEHAPAPLRRALLCILVWSGALLGPGTVAAAPGPDLPRTEPHPLVGRLGETSEPLVTAHII